jgi:1-aminocyclopropane-1-carboxylate deaminase/D-cysteine desulfhydrase-like pyridoxal-dependent ACC family enzyme
MTGTISPEALKARLATFPKTSLAYLPTPLEPCRRLSVALGGPDILVKRDDLTGLAFGGNKVRQLEYVFGAVLESGADTIVAGAYTQSNWCRQITAAACKHGLEVVLVLAHGRKGPTLQGNLLLDVLMGADVTVIPVLDEELQPHLEARAEELRSAGRKPFVVSSFEVGTQSLAALGYVAAVIEICEQLGRAPDYLYVAGSERSPAGLNVGVRALGLPTKVVSVSPIVYPEPRQEEIARIANVAAERLGLPLRFSPDDILVDENYIGEAYGIVSEAGREAMMLLARSEALILDPVYSSKAMSGLIDHVRKGRIVKGETVVFVHTGGLPALFSYAQDLGLPEVKIADSIVGRASRRAAS